MLGGLIDIEGLRKVRSLYVASLVVGMVAWFWALSAGIVWIFGA